ncbi:hypothetical protein BRE01_37890 [Brevibacillus reuszeri]|uniref:Coproporphyrinogen III oxidase n=1 Tax=Brevibacillus reuszeri TaxID=54915 RepID=A0ABQ0TQ88_9BACL|nr:hypothetical protein [Brevibacillus reuszeri]MED1860423.1 hypothetical protein [Brevibacillus reuszeri]GED70087.1 hypothetical protein BRE01_37890 [Brevibacillus reuszeri]
MALTHEFFLIRKEHMNQYSPPYEAMVEIHDDVINYIYDSLKWLPAFNPSTKESHTGLNYHGETIIQGDGAILLKNICLSWAELFSLAPQSFILTGPFTWINGENIETGKYEMIHCYREELTSLFKELAILADRTSTNGYCILHHGI